MKLSSVIMFLITINNLHAQSDLDLLRNSGLRKHKELIFEISDVKKSHCPECHVQLTRYSYKIEVRDAFLKIDVRHTSRGPIYTPYLDSYIINEKGTYTWDLPEPLIPEEGLYIGSIWQVCAPWGIAATGDCKEYQINYSISGKVEDWN